MKQANTLKTIHLLSTLWLVLTAGYIVLWEMVKANRNWWFIAFVSGYSTFIVSLLIALYLFAIFRGISRSQKHEVEHPLTTSLTYLYFYDISPFIGTILGSAVATEQIRTADYLLVTSMGAFWTTFVVWIVIDPLIGLVETLMPLSREHRRRDLATAKDVRRSEQAEKERILAEIEIRDEDELRNWDDILSLYAEKLSNAVVYGEQAKESSRNEIVEMGVKAWQMGGLDCMQHLYSMTTELCQQKRRDMDHANYVSILWDGIGEWRNGWFEGDPE